MRLTHDALALCLKALKKGAEPSADVLAAMATDDPVADAAEPMEDDDGSDDEEAVAAMEVAPPRGGKPGKKRASEGFRQKVGAINRRR